MDLRLNSDLGKVLPGGAAFLLGACEDVEAAAQARVRAIP